MRLLVLICFTSVFLLSSFNSITKNKLKLPEEFVQIPSGTLYMDFQGDMPDSVQRIAVEGFYMSKYEVTNLQYRQFFSEAAAGMTKEEAEKIACDSNAWTAFAAYCEPLANFYYSHPAYNNYPVVNVSYEGAMKYCEWLEERIQKDNPGFEIEVVLPTKAQWVYAARGGRRQAMFPWGNYYLRNKKKEPMCNFRIVSDHQIYRNRKTGKADVAERSGLSNNQVFTATVKSFYPNDFGLYNMCGNTAEIISEKGICMGGSWNDFGGDIHILAEARYDRSSPTAGFRPVLIAREVGARSNEQ